MTAPTDARADDDDIEVAAHARAAPQRHAARELGNAARPRRCESDDSAALAGGSRSKARSPRLRSRRTGPKGLAKSRTNPSVNAMTSRAIRRAPGIVSRSRQPVERRSRVLGNELGEARDIAQARG